jgi:hypothetical protein
MLELFVKFVLGLSVFAFVVNVVVGAKIAYDTVAWRLKHGYWL